VAAKALVDLEAQLAQKHRQQTELLIRAPIAGTVLPPRARAGETDSEALGEYAGTPLEQDNLGCYLETGTQLCFIGSPAEFEALVIVHESEIPLLSVGQRARLMIDAAPGSVLSGEVLDISKKSARELPPELLAAGAFATERGPNGRIRPQSNYYQVTLKLDAHAVPLISGGLGQAKIIVDPEPLGLRLYRNLRGTFRLPF
jgi:putative peptide zinc metalloprotease protein